MATEKIDADVLRTLDRLAEDAGDPRVLVIVAQQAPAATPGEKERIDFDILDERGMDLQRGILDQLGRMGVREVRRLRLANAVVAELTREQILELAKRPDVRRIHLARPEQVTTG
jgi:hypothetical protein